ncbi:DUF3900 domain-containing protein [Paenibacillus sp. IHBB 10380]|uniref:DUF3900 domain-containing protein n=1 Tax=Paenibacillus sp. IHBB 10380 TaxID=1566358 RepID=UPI0005CFB900|nr:DUF3900 domain-containing protein [Paenibacillus sp. IHBB 10380]AJS58411.1 hypothetical protein UB51_07755 [Paenibacillus sp. IHBB 10380]
MKFDVQYLSFFVIKVESKEGQTDKSYKHYQTMDGYEYLDSDIKKFLDGEFTRISKRKVEKNPNTEQSPTKIGRFIVEPGHELTSNPNFNMLVRLRTVDDKDDYKNACDDLVRIYLDTSSVRGGALIIVQAALTTHPEDPFIFVLKCDFENKIARISEKNLVREIEMAISARNMKSIQYPYMPEEGLFEEWELKIHQSSHARYFEEFLKFITYEQSIPEIVNEHVMEFVQTYVENKWPDASHEERHQEERELELWAASDKRTLQEKWEPDQVVEAASRIVDIKPEIEIKFKLGDTYIKGFLADYGNKIHLTKLRDGYAVVIEGDAFTFDKSYSPVELLQPESFRSVAERLLQSQNEELHEEDDQ